VKAIEEFKTAVYGENYNEEEEEEKAAGGAQANGTRKRKIIAEKAAEESKSYDWADLAESGKVL
jgi:ATP-dependent DNA helicase 2 subunit 1